MKRNQLSLGIKTEMEHAKTIKKIEKKNLSAKQGARLIALDHLKEDKNYYSKLCKMEKKC